MQETNENASDGDTVFAFGRTGQQRAIDIFKGETGDRLEDKAYADPRETKLLKLYQLVESGNRFLGEPVNLPSSRDDGGKPYVSGKVLIVAPPVPPLGDQAVLGVRDP